MTAVRHSHEEMRRQSTGTGLLATGDVNLPRFEFGLHLIMDLAGCDKQLIEDQNIIGEWAVELVRLLDMRAYGEPQIVWFGEEKPVTAGYTAVQLIHTSSIVGHFSGHLRTAHLDVFSCKTFDPEIAMAWSEFSFRAAHTAYTVIGR